MTLKEIRALGAGLYRDGVMTGATMTVPRRDFEALVREVDGLMYATDSVPEAKPAPEALIVRTVCGDIVVSAPPGCEQVSTVYRARAPRS